MADRDYEAYMKEHYREMARLKREMNAIGNRLLSEKQRLRESGFYEYVRQRQLEHTGRSGYRDFEPTISEARKNLGQELDDAADQS
jgi:hypothetical protein